MAIDLCSEVEKGVTAMNLSQKTCLWKRISILRTWKDMSPGVTGVSFELRTGTLIAYTDSE